MWVFMIDYDDRDHVLIRKVDLSKKKKKKKKKKEKKK